MTLNVINLFCGMGGDELGIKEAVYDDLKMAYKVINSGRRTICSTTRRWTMDVVMRAMQHGACDDPEAHAKTRRKTTPREPKAMDLRIRILAEHPRPDSDGRWRFFCSFPRCGSPDVRIVAKTEKRAMQLLEEYLYNELDGAGVLEDMQ